MVEYLAGSVMAIISFLLGAAVGMSTKKGKDE